MNILFNIKFKQKTGTTVKTSRGSPEPKCLV